MEGQTTDPYAELFEMYLAELREACEEALAWWHDLLRRHVDGAADPEAETRRLRSRWPLGPVAHPRVIAVYRKYYLAVDAVNQDILEREETPMDGDPLDARFWVEAEDDGQALEHPRAVLYERLDRVDPHLARFMDYMVFVPIGADRDGRLV
jgi:hypothetical protein